MATQPYDLTTHDGRRVDAITKAALQAAEKKLGYELSITQGSYNAGGVAASAGTHDGGGVVDLPPYDHANKVRALRSVGFAAWYRPELWRNGKRVWSAHIHAVLIGNAKLSKGARNQVTAYLAGRDGLAANGRDTGPRDYVNVRFKWKPAKVPTPTKVTKARELLTAAYAKQKNKRPQRAAKIKRALDALPKK